MSPAGVGDILSEAPSTWVTVGEGNSVPNVCGIGVGVAVGNGIGVAVASGVFVGRGVAVGEGRGQLFGPLGVAGVLHVVQIPDPSSVRPTEVLYPRILGYP